MVGIWCEVMDGMAVRIVCIWLGFDAWSSMEGVLYVSLCIMIGERYAAGNRPCSNSLLLPTSMYLPSTSKSGNFGM